MPYSLVDYLNEMIEYHEDKLNNAKILDWEWKIEHHRTKLNFYEGMLNNLKREWRRYL